MKDDWAPVTQPPDDWEAINRPPPPTAGEALPEAFIGRLRAGEAVNRIMTEAAKGAKEGIGTGTPTGFEDATLDFLIDKGIFHDPLKGKPGPLHLATEAIALPAAQLWQGIARSFSGGIHGVAAGVRQAMDEFGVSNEPGLFFRGGGAQAEREIINAGNWALIESGMGRFSRNSVVKDAQLRTAGDEAAMQRVMSSVDERTVGNLPTPEDFANAGKVMESPHAEANLRRMWQKDGIHPAEAVHDAETDAFVKHEITAPHVEISATPPNSIRLYRGERDWGPYPNEAYRPRAQFWTTDVETAKQYGEPRYIDVAPEELASNFAQDVHGHYQALNGGFEYHPQAKPLPETIPKSWDVPVEEMEEAFGKGASLSAAVTDPADIPLDVQPPRPPSSLIASATAALDNLFDVGRDIQMKLAPMARGSVEAMATVKDYMNAMRRNAWDASRIDTDISKRFTPEQRARMWNAMEEESLSLRLGEPESARAHQGLNTLTPEERAAVIELDRRQQIAWLRARDLGMVEGEGIAMHAPRMVINIKKGEGAEGAFSLDATGYDLRTRAPGMKQRKYMEVEETERAAKAKYGEQAVVARDIRTVNLATSQLEDAIAGRTLIENIKDVGKRTGDDVVAEGFQPDKTWFTVDHPAFKTWRPKFQDVEGKIEVVKDAEGKPVFEQVPIYVRGDFEGPLRAAMWGKTGEAYAAMMSLKGKTMGLIMNSPMIHNMVEYGRAFATAPVKMATFKMYRDGYKAKNDPGIMHEAIANGLVPIGKRFFNQDITGLMEAPDLAPGRSITAKVTAAVPGLFDEAAGVAVKRSIDRAGDFWHNTLLWDRIADLQMGLYVNFRGDMIAKGMDSATASKIAAHYANRYAGALPREAMSEAATKVSNMLFFSRSFTFGNFGVMKDMLIGLPKDVLAQIERDAGFKAGSIDAGKAAATAAKSIARRKAIAVVALDVGLGIIGNSILQSAFNIMLGQGGFSQEGHEYLRRFKELIDEGKVHPLQMLNPFHVVEKLSATDDNEASRKDRILVGYAKDGTAIYARNPVGKIGEEFAGYFGSPIDMIKKKQGTIARPIFQIVANDAGFGRKIYDPNADTAAKKARSVAAIAKHLAASQLPEGQLNAFADLVGIHPGNLFQGKNPYTGPEGDAKVNALQAFGPFAGVTFSKGAPGGPAVGEMYASRAQYEFARDQAMPDIRRQIKRGDIQGARDRMMDLNIPLSLQAFYIRTTLDPALRMSPRAVQDFYLHSTEEQRRRFDRARAARPQP